MGLPPHYLFQINRPKEEEEEEEEEEERNYSEAKNQNLLASSILDQYKPSFFSFGKAVLKTEYSASGFICILFIFL